MKTIDADDFISQMKDLYHRAGWDEREVHFSLRDLICNIANMKTVGEKTEGMRLIDANAFIKYIKDTISGHNYKSLKLTESLTVADVLEHVVADLDGTGINGFDNAPTVELKPKEGEWWGDGDGYADGQIVLDMWTCSECGAVYEADEPPYRCCPNCGAKMRNYE